MARKKRIHFKNANYHVMLRGNFGGHIFHGEDCHLHFYKLLASCCNKYSCKIHLFCLMTNHIHLVINVGNIPLPKIIMSLASTYSRYLNKLLDRRGHVFQGRYLAKLVSSDNYLLALCQYIHNNPVKAKMVDNPASYPWSSYHCYFENKTLPWLTTDLIHSLLSQKIPDEEMTYFDIINKPEGQAFSEQSLELDEKGDIRIVNSINAKVPSYSGQNLSQLTLDEIITEVCSYLKIDESEVGLGSLSREVVLARSLITYIAHYSSGYMLKHIAYMLGLMPDSISRTMHKYAQQKEFKRIEKNITYRLKKLMSLKLKDTVEDFIGY